MLDIVIEGRKASLAPGMEVRRILPFRQRRMVGPFIFMDHAGSQDIQPTQYASMDVLPHPHIGLSTVSYLFGGKVMHRDSLGYEQIIEPGEVNWMTAGSGIAHSERFEDPAVIAGGELEMIQTWVALPAKDEENNPSFVNYKKEHLPVFTDKGVWMRLIAGNAYGLANDVKTNSPLFYLHAELEKGARFGLPAGYSERAIYITKGNVEISGKSYLPGQMLVFSKGVDPIILIHQNTTLMLLGGEPVGERYIWWNFVSSRKERIEQAKADWKAGRILLPPTDNKVFVPLPEDKFRISSNPAPDLLS
jgi:redox-sensitive bicupin YhaK (pirin superfamily)